MANPEEIGFHKGAISTLIKERQELVKMVQIVEALIKAHSEALEKLGVSLSAKEPEKTETKKVKKK